MLRRDRSARRSDTVPADGQLTTRRHSVRLRFGGSLWPQALKELGPIVASGGKLEYREAIAQFIESARQAIPGLPNGRIFGKQPVMLV